jgi:4-amino-4-deoxy-L-arabinose transferase-like glycosyltransferase
MREAFAGCWKRTSGVLAIALVLRLFFALACPHIAGDSPIYEAFARNVLEFHTYSHIEAKDHSAPRPTLIRTPGYPLMLALIFAAAGKENETAVRVVQAVIDTFTCILIALIAFEISSGDIGRRRRLSQWALVLSAVCPFVANYSASILTEVPTTFLWTAATLFGLRALKNRSAGRSWFCCGILTGGATLFRPESGMLIGIFAIVLFLKKILSREWKSLFAGAFLMGSGLLIVLAPWVARNALTLRSFQMLAPMYAEDSGERVTLGYYAWCTTWLWTYQDVVLYLFPLETENLPTGPLPAGSYESAAEQQVIREILIGHNQEDNYLDPKSDKVLESIADEHRRKHPLRFYILLPFLRSLTMWCAPRTEILELEGRLLPVSEAWENDPVDFSMSLFMFSINAIYVVLGILGAISNLSRTRSFEGTEYLGCFTLLAIILIRTSFLAFFAYPEPRYILEAYPDLIILGAFWLARVSKYPDSEGPARYAY